MNPVTLPVAEGHIMLHRFGAEDSPVTISSVGPRCGQTRLGFLPGPALLVAATMLCDALAADTHDRSARVPHHHLRAWTRDGVTGLGFRRSNQSTEQKIYGDRQQMTAVADVLWAQVSEDAARR